MKRGSGSTSAGLALPLRVWAQRFTFLLLVAFAFGLMLLSKAETVIVERARVAVVDVATPVLEVLSAPAAAVDGLVERVGRVIEVYAQNDFLLDENERLGQWQELARRLQAENAALKAQLSFVPDARPRFVTARVVADAGGVFVKSVLVNAGDGDSVRRGQAAMHSDGLVGRVSSVGDRSARVILLTDLNSRIPVVIESTGDRAILAGNNGPRPLLQYLPANAPISPGDRVVTSGHGGVFPQGLAVGTVSEVSETGIRVQPYVDWARMDYVRILDFGAEGILPPPTTTFSRAPPVPPEAVAPLVDTPAAAASPADPPVDGIEPVVAAPPVAAVPELDPPPVAAQPGQ